MVLEVARHGNQRRKRSKKIQTGKEVKLSLFADDMILYIENPKDVIRKLLEFINEFGKVAGNKINTEKSLALLYTNNKRSEREIKETIPFTITLKRVKYGGISLHKEAKHVYSEYNKKLMRETEGDTNRWKVIPSSQTERINIVKMTISTKQSTESMKLQMTFFTEREQKKF